MDGRWTIELREEQMRREEARRVGEERAGERQKEKEYVTNTGNVDGSQTDLIYKDSGLVCPTLQMVTFHFKKCSIKINEFKYINEELLNLSIHQLLLSSTPMVILPPSHVSMITSSCCRRLKIQNHGEFRCSIFLTWAKTVLSHILKILMIFWFSVPGYRSW